MNEFLEDDDFLFSLHAIRSSERAAIEIILHIEPMATKTPENSFLLQSSGN